MADASSQTHSQVYLDNHATTPTDARVVEAMLPFFQSRFGNAASVNHAFGWEAADAVQAAREQIATLLGADARCIVFTSGATEANNLAIKGVMRAAGSRRHLVTNAAEHPSVLDPSSRLSRAGFEVTFLPVDDYAMVSPQTVANAIRDDTALVSVMLANNEVGTINPIAEIGNVCREHGVLLHCDAVQAAGRVPIDLEHLPVDLLSVSAHKLYGPMGIGALFVRRDRGRVPLEPLLHGGGHENHLRSGTLPVPLAVGFGAASQLALEELQKESTRILRLREDLFKGLKASLPDLITNGHPDHRLAGTLNVSIPRIDGEALMMSLTQIAVSSGSACSSANPAPSHVLRAMGRSDVLTRASIRFGIGRFNTDAEIAFAIEHVVAAVARLRG